MRISSLVTGICHLVVGSGLGLVAPKFGAIYADLLSPDAALPALTHVVLALAPAGWIVFGVVSAALLIGKDLVPSLHKIPNWPFTVGLFVLVMVAVTALFLPLIVIVETF